MKPPVYRIESFGETIVQYPTLPQALCMPPRHPEGWIGTSLEGVRLAEASPNPDGSGLCWKLTLAGVDVVARHGWRNAA